MDLLEQISSGIKEDFKAERQILSFKEYIEQVEKFPHLHIRSAAQYLKDCFDYYGFYEVQTEAGPARRWKLFDRPFPGAVKVHHGQELVQNRIYSHLSSFAQRGRTDKLILLHGPNATGKSTIIQSIMGGLESYSQTDEGAMYTFNWIFSDHSDKGDFGFLEKDELKRGESLAHAKSEDIHFRIRSGLRESPLFLLPRKARIKFLEEAFKKKGLSLNLKNPICEHDMGHKFWEIYKELLDRYKGDWLEVLKHVQISRLIISKRYRTCAVSIEPQRNVDAQAKALTLDKDFDIPQKLKQANLHEVYGDLIDGNRGVIEYSDFFKRNVEVNKYLLTTAEQGTASLNSTLAYLDVVLFGTSNEKHLEAFKRDPDFSSFKGRFELVRVPYIRQWSKEAAIYRGEIENLSRGKHVSPHTAEFIGLWAVLTRLRKPLGSNYESHNEIKDVITGLTAVEKAHLYNSGEAPERLRDDQRKALIAALPLIASEFDETREKVGAITGTEYEGRRGVSAREIWSLVNDAALNPEYPCLSPLAILVEIEKLQSESTIHDFLRLPPDNTYGSVEELTKEAMREYRSWIIKEVRDSMELVSPDEYSRVFNDYIAHVKAWKQGEKIENRRTGAKENPNEDLMNNVEKTLGIDSGKNQFREDLMLRVAKWALDNPGKEILYHEIFSDLFTKIKDDYYEKMKKATRIVNSNILKYGTEEYKNLTPDEQSDVEKTLANMKNKYNYCDQSAKEVLVYILQSGILEEDS